MNDKILVPPIKCQGIKTKLIPFIRKNVNRDSKGIWIEPFVGTGVVALNIAPSKAILTDKNRYIIKLYQRDSKQVHHKPICKMFSRISWERIRALWWRILYSNAKRVQ